MRPVRTLTDIVMAMANLGTVTVMVMPKAITGIGGRVSRIRRVRHTTQHTGTRPIGPGDGGGDAGVEVHARPSHDSGSAIRASGSVLLGCSFSLPACRRPIRAVRHPGDFQIER